MSNGKGRISALFEKLFSSKGVRPTKSGKQTEKEKYRKGGREMPEEKKTEQITQLAQEMGSIGEMPQVKITRREREVMKLCCEGLLAKEIADRLNISQRTVETHKTNLFKKLGINNTMELVRYAQVTGEIK